MSRLKDTWDKVSAKYKKLLYDLKLILDPSFNMVKYRQLLRSEYIQPPIVSEKIISILVIIFPILDQDSIYLFKKK